MDILETNVFCYQEPIDPSLILTLPKELSSRDPIPEGILIRLLLGTIDVKHKSSGTLIYQRTNYTVLGRQEGVVINNLNCIFDEEPLEDLDKLSKYMQGSRKNKHLFENVLSEFANYFYHQSKESYITAFVHLYRCLEHISYCFPLVYSSKSTNYTGTYTDLKSFFTSDKGELKFFNTFVNEALVNSDILDLTISLDINCPAELETEYYKTIKQICTFAMGSNFTDNGSTITIKYKNLIDFIIELRNRFFHFLAGKDVRNLRTTEVDMEYVFGSINEDIANWLAYIYYEILKHGVVRS